MALPHISIAPGAPPLLWSNVQEAFEKVTDNFTALDLATGGTAVDLTDLGTALIPRTTELHDLGSVSKKWRDLYLSGNSLYLGDAVISATGTTVNLPIGSTIGGLRVDENYFKFIAVSGQSTIEADEGTDTLTITAGNAGIAITTNASTDTLIFSNTGVVSATAGTGIALSAATGSVTVTNTGVTTLVAGQGIGLSAGTGNVTLTNSGLVGIDPGLGITVSPRDPITGLVTVTNNQPNIAQNVFSTIVVPTQSDVAADSANDTLTVQTSGDGLSITTNAATDTITFANTGVHSLAVGNGLTASAGTGAVNLTLDATLSRNITGNVLGNVTGNVVGNVLGNITGNVLGNVTGDVSGSVFADDSTLLVDSTGSRLVGDVETARLRTAETKIALGLTAGATAQGAQAVAVGNQAGQISQGNTAVAIGSEAGRSLQGAQAVAIGYQTASVSQGGGAIAIGQNAGLTNQGAHAVAIGTNAATVNQTAGSIVFNASSIAVNTAAAGFYVRPIREVTGPQTVYYDPVTYEVTWGPVPAGGGGGGSVSVGEYVFKVAGDDSTQRVINNGETLQFIGAAGITTASDAEGTITISAAGVSGLASRTSAAASTGSIADAATATATVTGFKGYVLYKIQTSAAAWVRIYTSVAARTADSARLENVDPLPGSGVIAEIISTTAETILITPGTIGFNDESSPNTDIELAVTNKSGGTADITVTLTIVQVEA